MHLAGADEIYILGGVQALAALALGTETDRPASTSSSARATRTSSRPSASCSAKVGIDLIAGPTEILIVADETADPVIVAADLLGQAEHGPASPAVLVTTSRGTRRGDAARGRARSSRTCRPPTSPRRAWEDFGEVVVVDSDDEALALADAYAFEHVEIQTREPALVPRSGCGTTAPCSSARRRPWPTATRRSARTTSSRRRGAARYTGGLWVGKFLKTVTYQECDEAASVDDRRDLRTPVPDRELRGSRAQLRRPRRRSTAARCSSEEAMHDLPARRGRRRHVHGLSSCTTAARPACLAGEDAEHAR